MNFKYGDEWRSKVDLETLDIRSQKHCILGQTDGDYSEHKNKLELTSDNCADLGFVECGHIIWDWWEPNWETPALNKEWKKQLKA